MDDHIAQGRAALARGAWSEARGAFQRSIDATPTPEAYEGLGTAARYALDADAAFAAHEAGYLLARRAGDPDTAARLAVALGYDAFTFRGVAEAVGWVERAAMLVEGRPPSFASAFVPYLRGYMALLGEHDPPGAQRRCIEARRLAGEVGDVDLELLAVALEGLAMVADGRVAEGMGRLDAAAAAAVGGEMTDADSIETVCCFVIDACKRVRDIERAGEWCRRVRQIAERFGDRAMFAVCRVHYADVLLWHGDLSGADEELAEAVREMARMRPGRDVDAWARIAELRRRQGRTDEARASLGRAGGHRLHSLVEGLLALDDGDAAGAVECAERFLRRVGTEDRFERVAGLELLVRAAIAAGDGDAAGEAAREIAAVAGSAGGGALRAADMLARGRVAAAAGDDAAARGLMEDAVDLLYAAGARYDAAVAGLDLAAVLRRRGAGLRAAAVELAATDTLRELGARVPRRDAGPLSPREVEVLRLLARGRSNDEIAALLVLSVRTVERHVANIYAKVGASGRTARAAATAWAHTQGIA